MGEGEREIRENNCCVVLTVTWPVTSYPPSTPSAFTLCPLISNSKEYYVTQRRDCVNYYVFLPHSFSFPYSLPHPTSVPSFKLRNLPPIMYRCLPCGSDTWPRPASPRLVPLRKQLPRGLILLAVRNEYIAWRRGGVNMVLP